MPSMPKAPATLAELWAGGASLTAIARESLSRALKADRHEWIHILPEERVLKQAAEIEKLAASMSPSQRAKDLPLMGMTFGVKDNIALVDAPMTNACDYRKGGAPVPKESAAVVQRLMQKGALVIGKTNMDCAATGLVGVRSVYGACQNSLNREFISGGSSSGSSVSVALGQVSFALGTDTAGSGRVPAMLNNIVGLKASRGLVSAHGLMPACKSLDCMTVFAPTVREAWAVLHVAASADGQDDAWDRPHGALTMGPRLSVPGQAKFTFAIPSKAHVDFTTFGEVSKERHAAFQAAWDRSIEALKAIGGTCVEIDYTPFANTAKLLYEGPWVAERYSALKEMIKANPDAIHPTVRKIVEPGDRFSAVQAFEAFYKLRELKAETDRIMKASGAQVLVTPTAGQTYRIAEVEADPVALNSNMGRYTNHMNLLDLCGIAVPTTFAGNFPFGLTISAKAGLDAFVCDIGERLHLNSGLKVGALDTPVTALDDIISKTFSDPFLAGVDTIQIAVSGAHMEGLVLQPQLTDRGGRFVKRVKTAPLYKLLAFDGMKPPRPGLGGLAFQAAEKGSAIEVEVWELPVEKFGDFMKLIAAPLGIGWLELEDGSKVQGFRLIDHGADRGGKVGGDDKAPKDITSHGGWRPYLASTGVAAGPPQKRARI